MKRIPTKIIALLAVVSTNSCGRKLVEFGGNFTGKREAEHIQLSDEELSKLPSDYEIISKEFLDELMKTAYNPPKNFTKRFNAELTSVIDHFMEFFKAYGEFGSYDRYTEGLKSDWYIPDDGYWESRSIPVDLLNPQLQTSELIEKARGELGRFKKPWMIYLHHDNEYDQGELVDEPGSYWFWVTQDAVLVFAERKEDIQVFLDSFGEAP